MVELNKEFKVESKEVSRERLENLLRDYVELNKQYYYKGEKVGWRNRKVAGKEEFSSIEEAIYSFIYPKVFTLILYSFENEEGFMLELYHHDSPTGERHFFHLDN